MLGDAPLHLFGNHRAAALGASACARMGFVRFCVLAVHFGACRLIRHPLGSFAEGGEGRVPFAVRVEYHANLLVVLLLVTL